MAIYSKLGAYPNNSASNTAPHDPLNIEAWADEAAQSLGTISPSLPRGVRGTAASLTIPLEETSHLRRADEIATSRSGNDSALYTSHREPVRRDSLKRREALLKGKEGSRRRQRWENDRLLSNPWAQPPLPSDWEVHPTYPKHAVPYYLAPLWDANLAVRQAAEQKKREAARQHTEGKDKAHGTVPKELREKMKKAKASKGLLQALEEEVRKFVKKWEENSKTVEKEAPREFDSEDEEIVFVGRNGQMYDMPPSPKLQKHPDENRIQKDQLIFDSPADDHGACFGRWLVHSIGSYYGLRTWSVTVGDPARREAYVGIKQQVGRPSSPMGGGGLPRPLWGMV